MPLAETPADGVPVSRLFFFIPPSPRAHLDILARLSRAIAAGTLRGLVERAAPDEELFRALAATDASGGEATTRGRPA